MTVEPEAVVVAGYNILFRVWVWTFRAKSGYFSCRRDEPLTPPILTVMVLPSVASDAEDTVRLAEA